MIPTLVIGYGNLLREDDGIGRVAAEHLLDRVQDPSLTVYSCHQLSPELAEAIAGASRVVFLDAAATGTPGEFQVRRLCAADLPAAPTTHHLDPEALLVMSRDLFGASPEATVVTVAGDRFEFGETLSAPVTQALPGLLRAVQDLLAGPGGSDPVPGKDGSNGLPDATSPPPPAHDPWLCRGSAGLTGPAIPVTGGAPESVSRPERE